MAINATEEGFGGKDRCQANIFISPIKIGVRIRVFHGTVRGCSGHITNIMGVSATFVEKDVVDLREVLLCDDRKDFNLGDCVEVIHGSERGTKGFIVHLDNISAATYV